MVNTPDSIELHATGGAQRYNLGAKIIGDFYPMQGNNYQYGAGNRRTLMQKSPVTEFSGPSTAYDRVPIHLTANKTVVTVYAEGANGTLLVSVKNGAGVTQGSGTLGLVFGARQVLSGSITGLTSANAVYVQVTLTGVSIKLYQIQIVEEKLTTV